MQNRWIMIRIVALALLLYSLTSLFTVRRELVRLQSLQDALSRELGQLKQEQSLLLSRREHSETESEMRRLAWERLGMVMPGEIVYYFNDGTE